MAEIPVYLALGSNLGDRARHLHAALQALARFATVEATSFLYETPPAYVTEQPHFLNAACRIRTTLAPQELLQAVEATMAAMGRTRGQRYGPRIIDIDILLYGDMHLESDALTIPHPRLPERDFVLAPLCDLAPDLVHPTLGVTLGELWRRVQAEPLPRVMPVGDRLWEWGRRTYIMGIVNATPDSFSGDGLGEAGPALVAQAVEQARRFAQEGADILDVGGHSTRPGHDLLPVDAELARVIPVVRALAQAVDLPISVDTFRAPVAEAALAAGAHAVNDVWGLRFDPVVAAVAARTGAPLMLMHNRLTVGYGAQLAAPPGGTAYDYADLPADIRAELGWSLRTAQAAGAPRWLLVADPGVGFGKTADQSLEIIRRLGELRSLGVPLLFGASRKGFIGKTLGGLPADQRLEGTLAAGVLAVAQGADILRVHQVQAAVRATRLADAVVRNS